MQARPSRAHSWVSGNTPAAAATAALLLATACGGSQEPVAEATPYRDPGYVEAGDYRLHYALTPARDLPAAIAGSYDILQRPNLAVLTVAIVPRDARADPDVTGARVEATAVSLMGLREPLALERRDAPGAATWIATVEVRHRVPLTIEIEARVAPQGPSLRARLTREFRLE
jgi:hypothetical protein